MSSEDFHVHGPHDHAVEHAAQGSGHGGNHGEGDSFVARIAVATAILSTLGAVGGYEAGHTQNAALLYKNEAAIQKTAASNQWNYYQAKSNKQNLAELSVTLTRGEKLEGAAREADKKSEMEMHVHGRWALSTTLLQVSIALSAIALLTRKAWLLYGVFGAAGIGVAFGVMGFLHM